MQVKQRANSYNTGIASEYFVLSQLYRLGCEAYITLGNKKSVDIRVVHNNRAISLDVKAVQGYSSLIVNNITKSSTHYIVFLIYNNKFEDLNTSPDVYVMPSMDVEAITKKFGDQLRVFKNDIAQYKNNWKCLFDDAVDESNSEANLSS